MRGDGQTVIVLVGDSHIQTHERARAVGRIGVRHIRHGKSPFVRVTFLVTVYPDASFGRSMDSDAVRDAYPLPRLFLEQCPSQEPI